MSTSVNGIKNMEAQTLNGISVQKIYFQPDVNLDLAIAQIVSATNTIRSVMPPGIQAPIVVSYNASSVPVLQLSLKSDRHSEQQLYDYGLYNLRQQLAPVPGVTFPAPDGGKYRQIMVGSTVEFGRCSQDEAEALEQLKANWARFTGVDKSTCLSVATVAGFASYVELLTCLEMAREANNTDKNLRDPKRTDPMRPFGPGVTVGVGRQIAGRGSR